MNWKSWLVYLSLAALAIAINLFVERCSEIKALVEPRKQDRAQTSAKDNLALRKMAEFLQPDTKSDIRFGRSATSSTPKP